MIGFNGFDTYLIDSARVDQKGVFKLRYGSDDIGMGYLVGEDEKPSEYVIVAFGSSDCPMCAEELQNIKALYPKWSRKGIEVVYVSLDSEKELFARKASGVPFLSYNDYRQWNSPPVTDYYVFATPTFYLLDANRNIILRPHAARQLDAWVDFYLKD